MEPISKERILSLENKLNLLATRLSDLERRLSALEQSFGTPKPVLRPEAQKIQHVYLSRTIDRAKRDYERKYR